MNRLLTFLAACVFLSAVIVQSADSVVSIRTIAPAGSLQPGKSSVLTVELNIAPRYHINSDRPLQDYLIPTTLELEPQPGLTFGKPVFPPAPLRTLPVSDSPMAVWEGAVKIAVEVTPSADWSPRDVLIKGKVRYQACDERSCLPPVREAFAMTLPAAGSAPAASLEAEAAGKAGSIPGSPAAPAQKPAPDFANRGLLTTVFLVFLGGLALNLTPCVYPMIPITITYFGGQAQGKRGSLFAHALLYVVGMAITYSILGVAAALTGGLFGSANRYPPVLIGIALVMVALALSMFDVYELRMPQFLNRLAGGSQKGFGGSLLMGLTVGIVAAPCVGPFVLGLLTYVGSMGSAALGFGLFFILALGMGVPFLVLGIFSGSLRRLPRSGAWMVWVRKVFGFILLAMAVYFLQPLFPGSLAYSLALALVLLLGGIYLAWIDAVPGSGKGFAVIRNIAGVLFFAAALYAAVAGLEPFSAQGRAPSEGQNQSGIQWFPYSESMLSRAAREAKPVFIDFYADWCAPCKELDKHTFSSPEVIARSRDFIMLKVDLTSAGDPQAEALRKKYQARGVPTLVFLRPDGTEIAGLRGTGFVPKETFLEQMNRAIQQIDD